jgi:hypothetical protein
MNWTPSPNRSASSFSDTNFGALNNGVVVSRGDVSFRGGLIVLILLPSDQPHADRTDLQVAIL